jgi:hypothetical protein
MNQDSMGLVEPDPHPSRPKWSQKIGQKQRNFLFVELSEGLEMSPKATKVNIFLCGLNKNLLVFLLNFFPIFVIKTGFSLD